MTSGDKNGDSSASQGTSNIYYCPETLESETEMSTDVGSVCSTEKKTNTLGIDLHNGNEKSCKSTSASTTPDASPWQVQGQSSDDMGLMTHLAFMQTKPASGLVHGNVHQSRPKPAIGPPPTLCGLPDTILEEGSEVESDGEEEPKQQESVESLSTSAGGDTQGLEKVKNDNEKSMQSKRASSKKSLHSSRGSSIPVGLKRVANEKSTQSKRASSKESLHASRGSSVPVGLKRVAPVEGENSRKRVRREKESETNPTSDASGHKNPAYRARPIHVREIPTKKISHSKHKTSRRDPLVTISNNRQLKTSSTKENIALKERRYRSVSNGKTAFGRATPELGKKSRVSLGNISNSNEINVKPFKANTSKQREMSLPERESKTMEKFLERQKRGREEHAKRSVPAAFHR